MSCITYTCECLTIIGNLYADKDFNEIITQEILK